MQHFRDDVWAYSTFINSYSEEGKWKDVDALICKWLEYCKEWDEPKLTQAWPLALSRLHPWISLFSLHACNPLVLMIAAHLFCLVASCILWGLHMCTVFPHVCCHLVSLVHRELAVTINPSHPSPSCLSIMCLCVSTDFTVLSNTLIPLNMSVFTDCLFTYWLVSRCQIPWKHAVKCLKIFWYSASFCQLS